MAESMQGLKRSCRCAETSSQDIGKTVTVMGWVQRRRNLGALIFVDVRDRTGLLQVVFDEKSVGSEGFRKAESIRNEFVIAVVGKVQKRAAAVNEQLKTGEIELIAEQLRILSESETPPFPGVGRPGWTGRRGRNRRPAAPSPAERHTGVSSLSLAFLFFSFYHHFYQNTTNCPKTARCVFCGIGNFFRTASNHQAI